MQLFNYPTRIRNNKINFEIRKDRLARECNTHFDEDERERERKKYKTIKRGRKKGRSLNGPSRSGSFV